MAQRITNLIERTRAHRGNRVRLVGASDSPLTARSVLLPAAGIVLGADSACDVQLEDSAVSRKHATIVPATGGFEVADLGSRNGTWLDGSRIERAMVAAGATLRIGHTLVQLLPAEEAIDIPPSDATSFGELLGASEPMRRVFAVLERASGSHAPVLLLGESGTGKELAARAIHERSPRRGGPFVVFDCGAASGTLIESELFGHKKGAFTGAYRDHAGAFASAHGGTLFLDEIGDLPLSLQPKLLRLLERSEVTPLGARAPERYDVRFIAATHRDLWADIGSGLFRGDLYYRLAVVEAHLPPLRQRKTDIPILVRALLRANGAIDSEVEGPKLERLLRYAWPGNVRELRNVIARAVALALPGSEFEQMPIVLRTETPADAEPIARADVPYLEAKEALLERFDRDYCTDLLQRAGSNLSEAARVAKIERKYLYRVLARAGIRPRPSEEDA
ncbi:sigma 54-interacting transcriptional regulator [Pendulispora albinea]|uniref:Sigma 54-interacting transcriptional regulator n=1 Tax=Pendulispora albinea TaxID=2741071 RepID=A0ABZ2LQ51_9BACT